MKSTLTADAIVNDPDHSITLAVKREGERLRNFIRRRVPDAGDAEDILQEVYFELVSAYRLLDPIEHVSAWMYRVARNRIVDLFRRRRPEDSAAALAVTQGDGEEELSIDNLLPSADGGPEAAYARSLLLRELLAALEELPTEQRDAFVGHEIDGLSFAAMAESSGLSINTLLARKRYAVLHLRRRLQAIHEEMLQP
jgi:RNA polymerase sigma factor (sigma-70 family)